MLAMTSEKQKMEHRLLRRLETRERFRQMLAEAKPSTERQDIARLKDYLTQWAAYERGYRESLGVDSAEPLAHQPTSASAAGEYLERSDRMAMQTIETCVADLITLPEGSKMIAAVRLRYLHEGIEKDAGRPVRVFRNHRLAGLTSEQVEALADRAEEAMVPWAKRRGLPL